MRFAVPEICYEFPRSLSVYIADMPNHAYEAKINGFSSSEHRVNVNSCCLYNGPEKRKDVDHEGNLNK